MTEPVYLWEIVKYDNNIYRRQKDEQQIVLPANFCKGRRCSLKEWNCCQEEYRQTPGHSFGANVGREDLSAVYESIGIDAATVASISGKPFDPISRRVYKLTK